MTNFRFVSMTVCILCVALGLRCAVAFWWQERLDSQGQRFSMGDSESYWFLARQIASQQAYFYNTPDAAVFRTPGYPWLLSFIVDVDDPDGRVLGARVLGCVLGTLSVAFCMGLTAILFDRKAAILCGILATIYPGAITTSVLVLSEAPFMPLMMMVLFALCMVQRQPQQATRWTIVAGAISGLAILVRPSWLLFMPFYYLYRFCFFQDRVREFKLALIAGATISVVMLPWWIRNYQVTGHFVLTTLQTGPTLYDGFHAGATGGSDSGMTFTGDFAAQLRAEDQQSARNQQEDGPEESPEENPTQDSAENFEYRLNKRLTSAAMDWVFNNPGQAIALGYKKFYRTWWPLPSANELPGGWPVRMVFAIGMLGILIPGMAKGFAGLLNSSSHLFPIIIPVLYFALLHTVFVGSIRYRQPAIFALTVLAAPQLLEWCTRFFPPKIEAKT